MRDVSCVVCKRFSSFDSLSSSSSSTRSGSARVTRTGRLVWCTERKGGGESKRDRRGWKGKKREREGEGEKKRKSVELIRVRDNAVAV